MPDFSLIDALASTLLAGEPEPDLLIHRCRRVLARRWRWLRPLTERYTKRFGTGIRPRHREVIQFLRRDGGLRRAMLKYAGELVVAKFKTVPQRMISTGDRSWTIPPIESAGDLAKWLGLNAGELRWFADLRALGYKQRDPRLEHYHYRVISKRADAVRLIEAPKFRLKDLQRQILMWILDMVPAHPAAHGFVKGRSIRTFVAPHVAKSPILRIDLRDFFPTLGGVRIQNVFRTLGYPEAVADLLGGVCSNATPRDIWDNSGVDVAGERSIELRRLYARPHLPQGAPITPLTQKVILAVWGFGATILRLS